VHAAEIERHLQRMRDGSYERDLTLDLPSGRLRIEGRDAAPIRAAIEHVLERLVKRARRAA
jgi:ribosome-associated translation inhibitor RaiA